MLIYPVLIFAQLDKISFEHFNTVVTPYRLFQDHYGFIWFGSRYRGLYCYDGYEFFSYLHNPDDENSLSENSIRAIAEDREGNLWIGTIGGLNKLNRATGKIQRFLHDPTRLDSPSHNYINSIYIDKAGVIWFGTQEGGLNEAIVLKNKKDGSDSLVCRHYLHDPDDSSSISHDNVKVIWEHSQNYENNLWVGTAYGLNRFDKITKKFTHYIHNPNDSTSPGHDEVWSIHEDDTGSLWFGTGAGILSQLSNKNLPQIKFKNYDPGINKAIVTIASDQSGNLWMGEAGGQGLFRFDPLDGKITNFTHDSNDPNSLGHNAVYSVMIDKSGALWVGRMDGIDKYDPHQKKFHHVPVEPPPNRWAIELTSFCEDHLGFVWIGSLRKGIIRYDPRSGNMTNYNHIPDDPNSLCCPWVLTIYEDKDEILWIGTPNGLDRFDRRTGIFHHFFDDPSKPDNPNTLLSDYIYKLYEDKHGGFWISTPRGLSKLDRSTGRFTHYLNDAENQIGLAGHCIGVIYESPDQDTTLWLGAKGLFRFNPQTGKLSRYYHDPDNPNSWISYLIYGIQQDKMGNLWVATSDGLYCLRTDKTIVQFTMKDGLPDNLICGILQDDAGLFWISTRTGLVRCNPRTQEFRRYEMREGFAKNGFSIGSYTKGKSGYMYFGQLSGFKMFHPREIKDNPYTPPVWITNFRVFDRPIEFNRPIPDIKEIQLSYRQNFFTFDFVALNYTESQKNQYAYMLEGVDPDWVYCGARRHASYTNIHPGKYLFKVKGANNDGIWNEQGTSVRIIITPPWWRTGWAYAFYALILGSIVVGLWRFQVKRIQIRNELKMKNFETQKLHEIDSMKSRFFANISHEFRTPLTLILGPISKILTKTNNYEIKQELNLMQRNARRLQRLINQLLDLSKIEAGRMTLQARPENIVALLNRIVQTFESQAKLKGIDLKFQSAQDEIIAYIDRDKIENIFYNLLSNALKFTPENGSVSVSLNIPLNPPSKGDFSIPPFEAEGAPSFWRRGPGGMLSYFQITISDTGIGIPPNRLDKIFDRFYQVDDSYTREHEGSGIGLALTKELVELHHGKIEVQSELNKGTTFTVYLPLGKEHLKPKKIVTEMPAEEFQPREEPSEGWEPSEGFTPPSHRKALPLVLIVEDNRDMRSYMQDCLASDYRVIEAVDGDDGLHRAIDKIPDLIISDVMMPKMDGFELCGRLKSDERTSHIPVILLTARASAESKIRGLELGADDYLIKPFDTTELRVRVRNLIEQRRKLREKFGLNIFLKPSELVASSFDQKFLQRAMDIIEKYLSNPDFNVATLTREVGMSRMQLHRKLLALTNQSASQFIRSLRLKRAAALLNQKYGNVAQISYEVGFNNPSYFAECFRKQFGKLPSEYKTKEL